jgi:hypothetical protein
MAYPYTGKPPGAGGIQNLRGISPPLTVVKVAAPGLDDTPGLVPGFFMQNACPNIDLRISVRLIVWIVDAFQGHRMNTIQSAIRTTSPVIHDSAMYSHDGKGWRCRGNAAFFDSAIH